MTIGVLIVEDEVVLAKNMARYLARHGCDVRTAGDGVEAIRLFEGFKPDVVLLDYNLPGTNGLEILKRMRAIDSQVRSIVITAHGNVRVAVEAMKAGAQDYLSKPVALDELKLVIDKIVGQQRIEGALTYYRGRGAETSGLDKIIGQSPVMQKMRQRVAQLLEAERNMVEGAAPPVLITGETGTGKELVARALHFDGARRVQPFVEINCSAIPAHLVESELFGHERGAFTDARERKLGLVESAHGGTLFLDEIGDLDQAVQVKLLKLLEDKVVRRVGSVRDQTVDIRIVTATNRPLDQMVREGKFRADLLFRLRVISVELPPLRDRGDDIVLLAGHFLAEHGHRYGKPDLRMNGDVSDLLLRHSWPGNVRELRNAIEQAVLLSSGGVIEPNQFPFQVPCSFAAACDARNARIDPAAVEIVRGGGIRLEDVERDLIARALAKSSGNVTTAARSLGVSRDTLRYRIRKHGLPALP